MKIKKIIGVLAVLCGVYLCSVYAYAAEVIVKSETASDGGTVTVTVSIKPSGEETESVNGYIMALTFDGNVLTPVE